MKDFQEKHFGENGFSQTFFARHFFTPDSQNNIVKTAAGTGGSDPFSEEDSHVPKNQADNEEAIDGYEDPDLLDQDLGYYPDGVKRTLTDAQIAIFRHTEIQEMLKAKRKQLEAEALEQSEQHHDDDADSDPSAGIQEYSLHDSSARPAFQDSEGGLPWNDDEVGAWEQVKVVEGKKRAAQEAAEEERRQRKFKPTFDAPSGRQFLWPAIQK